MIQTDERAGRADRPSACRSDGARGDLQARRIVFGLLIALLSVFALTLGMALTSQGACRLRRTGERHTRTAISYRIPVKGDRRYSPTNPPSALKQR